MNAKLFLFLLSVLSGFASDNKAYVYGYKRFYSESTHTTIDLLYDMHAPVPNCTTEEFCALSREEAKKKLYPTEQKILNVLQEWEEKGYSCDLIWESLFSGKENYYLPGAPNLLGLDKFFGLTDLQSISFIPSDLYRYFGFFSLFVVLDEQGNPRSSYNEAQCSFEDPAPLLDSCKRGIYKNYGDTVWQNFQNLRSQVIKDVQEYFRESYSTDKTISYAKDFMQNPVAYLLCDVEILSHLLASKASRVIVYAGGAHCRRIAEFLEHNDDFLCLYTAVPSCKPCLEKPLHAYPELSLDCLKLFEEPPCEYASKLGAGTE